MCHDSPAKVANNIRNRKKKGKPRTSRLSLCHISLFRASLTL